MNEQKQTPTSVTHQNELIKAGLRRLLAAVKRVQVRRRTERRDDLYPHPQPKVLTIYSVEEDDKCQS